VVSTACYALRLHAVATPLWGGLTLALGGRKAFGSCVCRNGDSSASVDIALRTSCRRVATSFESVERAHTSRALSCSASETMIGLRSVCRSRCGRFGNIQLIVLWCAQATRLRFSASPSWLHSRQHPPPPNNSFKPTPHRGVNSVLCATLHAVATPMRGGLTQALGGRKALCDCVARNGDSSASIGVALRTHCRCVASSSRCVVRAQTSRALSWPASETVIGLRSVCRSRCCHF
jgi:hypothetical protein